MRAVIPTSSSNLTVSGFQISYELFGDPSAPPVLLLPCWQIAPSRHWKMQIPYLARYFRVIAWDPPGIGGGERTTDPAAFEFERVIDFGIGLLDHLGVEHATVVGFSTGAALALWMASSFPERVERAVCFGTATPRTAYFGNAGFWEQRDVYEGWQKRNAHYWRSDYQGWLEFFFHEVCSESHSSKLIEDLIGWAHETTPESLIASVSSSGPLPGAEFMEHVAGRVRCPVLLIHGSDDHIDSIDEVRRLAELRPDFELVELEESGHAAHGRDPVRINQEIARFLGVPDPKRRHWQRAEARTGRKALFISSPIGLGHIQRDLAIARELRWRIPDLEIDWLAQSPVTSVLERAGERIHPLSSQLASESAHWEEAAGAHELHCFQAFREMDEILLANFMVFLDVVHATPYDVWIGDEAWEVDHYLHENPELKTAPYVFMTDFVGWLPMDRSPGSREAELTADYNAQMVEQVTRYGRVRDRAIYIGDEDDLVPESLGPGLPSIPDWVRDHFSAVGYVSPFDPADYADVAVLRARLGYDPDRPLIVCAVGGTAVGRSLVTKVVDAWPAVRQALPDACCVVVTGPRIDPDDLPRHPGLTAIGYVHNLYEHLAAADLAVVQGGLSTTMELTVSRRPFLYFPLKNHCEQVYHVAHRLDRYGAGRRLEFDAISSAELAAEMLAAIDSDTSSYRPYRPGAAGMAADLIAQLL